MGKTKDYQTYIEVRLKPHVSTLKEKKQCTVPKT